MKDGVTTIAMTLRSGPRDREACRRVIASFESMQPLVAAAFSGAAGGEHDLLAHTDVEAVGRADAGAAFGDVLGFAEHEGVARHHDAGRLFGLLTGVTPALRPCEAPHHACRTPLDRPLGTPVARAHV